MLSCLATLKRQILPCSYCPLDNPTWAHHLGMGWGPQSQKENIMFGTTVSSDKKKYFLEKKDFDYMILLLFLTYVSTEGKKGKY